MKYTVNKLAKLSGVSISTIRFYDEIGLLKPTCRGNNGYRYYEEEQLLLLQQILFFRELGFQLNDIQKIIGSDDFDKVVALNLHRKVLLQNIERTQKLVNTIDKTILHLKGKTIMKNEELYYGFDSEKQKSHEKYLVENNIVKQEFLDECNKKVKNWSETEKNAFIHDCERIYNSLIEAMNKKLLPSDNEVQNLMDEHYNWLKRTWIPTKESYLGLAELYQTPDFRKFYDKLHPDLLEFMLKAMKIFAENKLS